MNYEELSDVEWIAAATRNDCFDFLSDDSEDIYSKEDGADIESCEKF